MLEESRAPEARASREGRGTTAPAASAVTPAAPPVHGAAPQAGGTRLAVTGTATAYRLYDLGYEIDLDRVNELLGADTRGRTLPARAEASAFDIRQPPVSAMLGDRDVDVGGEAGRGSLSAHVFDFGVCSLRLTVRVPARAEWPRFTAFGAALDGSPDVARLLDEEAAGLLQRLQPAITRPRIAPVVEEYVVFRIEQLELDGQPVRAADALTDEHLVPLLLGEQRRLAAPATRELLGSRFSYYADDLAVITWDNALVVEPRRADQDVEFVLEFANAQLLELRVYDAQLDGELPMLYDRISATRRRLPTGRFRKLLGNVQARVAEITEIVERSENAIKVIEDVYLARIYEKALELFRVQIWRRGVDRKLAIFRETYTMLNAEAQATRAELLELAIVLLILLEIVLSLVR